MEANAAFYPESRVQRCLHSAKQAPARLLQNPTQMGSPLGRASRQDSTQVGWENPRRPDARLESSVIRSRFNSQKCRKPILVERWTNENWIKIGAVDLGNNKVFLITGVCWKLGLQKSAQFIKN